MASFNNDEIVDVDALQFADDIEEIYISDCSGEEEGVDIDVVGCNDQNTSSLKIASVISLELSKNAEGGESIESATGGELIIPDSQSEIEILDKVGDEQEDDRSIYDDNSSECNFSYDSLTDGEEVIDVTNLKHAVSERQRRHVLRSLYHNLWKAISSEPLKPTCSKFELLSMTSDMIKKLTLESRKLEYSTELCMQSNYRLKRRVKRLLKKKRRNSNNSRLVPTPGKVVTSRASI